MINKYYKIINLIINKYMNEDNKEEEEKTLKGKKIRRLLLLKTDEELKMISKKKSNLMINSTTINEMNKCYNLYSMELSEKSRIYFNFVKTEEKIVSNNKIQKYNSVRTIKKEDKLEQPNINILLNISEEDSNSPMLSFFPKKINLGAQKFNQNNSPTSKKKLDKLIKKNTNIEKTTSNEEKINSPVKLQKKGLFKLVDKIINIKMNEDIEEKIKKNIIKLRKYCNGLKIPKRKLRRLKKQKTQTKIIEKCEKRGHFNKRMTITNMATRKVFFSKKILNENDDKKIEKFGKRIKNRFQTTKYLENKIKGIDALKDGRKLERMSSTRILKKVNYINKEKLADMKNKQFVRKYQTLSGDVKGENYELNKIEIIKYKNSENNKNEDSIISSKRNSKNHLLSSKFQRPKFQFNNSTININYFYKNIVNNKEQIKSKFNPRGEKTNKNLSIKKKKENSIINHYIKKGKNERNQRNLRPRFSTRKTKKNIVNIYDKYFRYSKKEDSCGIIGFERKDELEDELEGANILSEFNKKNHK